MPKLSDKFSTSFYLNVLLVAFLIIGCDNPNKKNTKVDSESSDYVQHAKVFRIDTSNNQYLIEILDPENNNITQQISVGGVKPSTSDLHFTIAPKRIVLLSTTYIAYLESLGELSSVCGLSNPKLIYSPQVKELIEQGKIRDVGNDASLNMEVLIDLQPDLVLYYNFSNSTTELAEKIRQLDIPVVFINEFQESTPLGKAEWIKIFGLLFDKKVIADSIFNEIELEYQSLLEKTASFKSRPTVFTGLPWKGQWYQPGGRSFQAQFFHDAGADYIWSDDEHVSGITIDREVVFEKALKADFWLHPSNSLSLNDISAQDNRYESFLSFELAKVYNNNKRLNKDMGNDFWESGIMNPHIVLKDLMCLFHPELFPDRELVYYQKLN